MPHIIYSKMNDRINASEKHRCRWCNTANPLYVDYHDNEWGVPVHDDRKLFEMLLLETFQPGLSWECVLGKRENFRAAFDCFDCEEIARYGEDKVASLLQDKGIIRNALKIRATVANAAVFMDIQREYGSFDRFIWSYTGGEVIREHEPVSSPLSDRISADLKKRGMKFVGTKVVYSFLQAVGIVNSHEPGCWRYHADDAV